MDSQKLSYDGVMIKTIPFKILIILQVLFFGIIDLPDHPDGIKTSWKYFMSTPLVLYTLEVQGAMRPSF